MKNISAYFVFSLVALSILLQNCSGDASSAGNDNAAETSNSSANDYYTVDDFKTVEKFDSHIHLNTFETYYMEQAKEDNMRFLVIVDDRPFGLPMEEQQKIIVKQLKAFPDQIAYATTFSVKNFDSEGFVDETIAYLKNSFANGAIAVKVWKNVGMDLRDKDGKFVMIDHPKFDPILDYLAKNNIPLIGHLGEPKDCWLPLDSMTFHQGYYRSHPEYHMFLHPEYPSYEDQINAKDNMLAKHPDLKFVGAHMGSLEWSLDELADRLDRFPNMAVDLARMSNINYHAMIDWQKTHDFFVKYQDRLLYATDVQVGESKDPAQMKKRAHESRIRYWNFFTTDEMFKISGKDTTCKGLKLPREVIDKIYRKNAEKWLPGV